jgi:hypothetical protein
MPNMAFLGQRMAELVGEHSDLTAVVGVVRDQVAEKSGDIGAKAFDAAITLQGVGSRTVYRQRPR